MVIVDRHVVDAPMPAAGDGSYDMPEQDLHVVVGAGPVGRALIGELAGRGLRVRVVARHGVPGLPAGVETQHADITDHAAAGRATASAAVVYHAASAPYHRWPELLPSLLRGVIAGARAAGARLVYADNLYAYGPVDGPLTEDLPSCAEGPNGHVRALLADQLLDAHARGSVRVAIGRASDFYGPWGRQSTAGERLFVPALRGKATQVLGDPDMPHTYTYLGDFARGLATLGTHDEAFGQVWHLPSAETLTTRAFVELVYQAAGNPSKLSVMSPVLLRLLALASPMLKAVREQQYQRDRSWVVDHTKFARAFGAEVTPHADAIASTLAWWRQEEQAASPQVSPGVTG
ncbi:MAG TPA: NAD-dependent epimerase/dehydratase family protein [Candidatus Limnocylindrales bacterium]|nr:NAD-dependent epimerase/dehydratase family protein [Candidatus Limnocylindrales bacterium]